MEPSISIKGESAPSTLSREHCLSILVTPQKLTYTVLDKEKAEYILLRSFDIPLPSDKETAGIINSERLLQQSSSEVILGFSAANATLVPEEFYREEQKEAYYAANYNKHTSEVVLADQLPLLKARQLYALEDGLLKFYKEKYPAAKVVNASTAVIHQLGKLQSEDQTGLYVNVQGQEMQVFLFKGKKLILQNNFSCHSPEDFLYFIMFIYEQTGLNAEKDGLVFLGEIEQNSLIYDQTYKYIKNIRFIGRPAGFNYGYQFNILPQHYFFNLFSLASCE